MRVRTVAICASQVPFRSGGAENLVASLHREFKSRGFKSEIVQLPFKWYPRVQLLKTCLAWRLLDLTESDGEPIDLVVATKFPSYAVRHPSKVTWLVHQFRQVYDLYGTEWSDFGKSSEDLEYRQKIAAVDNQTLRESRQLFSIARNVSDRLQHFNGLTAEVLYHPPKLAGLYRTDVFGDYIFTVSRLDRAKRLDLLVRAMREVRSNARLVIAGMGPEQQQLESLISQAGLDDRVALLGFVSDEELVDLYAKCCAVAYVPFDEDYGYVTLEAFASGKPVITANDSGGVLEFVEDGVTGFVSSATPESIAIQIDNVWLNRGRAADMGRNGQERIRDITWDRVIDRLVHGLDQS